MRKIYKVIVSVCTSLFIFSVAQAQVFPELTWQTKDASSLGFDAVALEKNLNALGGTKGNITVIKDGYLVASKGDISKPLAIYSESKSVTALFCARALQLGKIKLDDLVQNSDRPSGALASYRDFVDMMSDYGLTPHNPGENYAYNNYAVDHYGSILLKDHFGNVSKADSMNSILYSQMGGHEDNIYFDGIMSGWGKGWSVSSRDMARLGWLIASGGNWDGRQILPKSFCDELFIGQIPLSANMNLDKGPNDEWNQHEITKDLQGNYSHGFWLAGRFSDKYTDEPMTWMSGYMGNKVYIIKEKKIVVAVTNTIVDASNRPADVKYVDAVLNAYTGEDPIEPQ